METAHLACSVGIVIFYQEISTEKEILEVDLFITSHIVHCDFSLRKKWKAALCTLFLAHFHLLFETGTPTSIEFLPIFLCFSASIVTISNLDSWRPQNPQTQSKNCYALCCLAYKLCSVQVKSTIHLYFGIMGIFLWNKMDTPSQSEWGENYLKKRET